MPVNNFNVDHVFEVQLISLFLEWVCGTNKQASYGADAKIPWPSNWGRPDVTWCTAVFGSMLNFTYGDDTLLIRTLAKPENDGFLFTLGPGDSIRNSFIGNTATKLGNDENLNLLAVLLNSMNQMKGVLLGGKQPQVPGTGGTTAVMKINEKKVHTVRCRELNSSCERATVHVLPCVVILISIPPLKKCLISRVIHFNKYYFLVL